MIPFCKSKRFFERALNPEKEPPETYVPRKQKKRNKEEKERQEKKERELSEGNEMTKNEEPLTIDPVEEVRLEEKKKDKK